MNQPLAAGVVHEAALGQEPSQPPVHPLLDFNATNFDVNLFDETVGAVFNETGYKQQEAQQLLSLFQDHVDAWLRVPDIFEKSSIPESKFIAMQVLTILIATRWKTMPDGQRRGIRSFLIKAMKQAASDHVKLREENFLANKINTTLAEIVKQDWPHNWPNLIPELLSYARTKSSMCENAMVFLRILSQDIFDFSSGRISAARVNKMKEQLIADLPEVFELIIHVLEKSQEESLGLRTLETLYTLLSWIPINYIFESSLIDVLLQRFLEVRTFRTLTAACLAEIVYLEPGVHEHEAKLTHLVQLFLSSLDRTLSPDINLAQHYVNAKRLDSQMYAANCARLLVNYLTLHGTHLETSDDLYWLEHAHAWLLKFTAIPEQDIFKLCINYWLRLGRGLYREILNAPLGSDGLIPGLSMSGSRQETRPVEGSPANTTRNAMYAVILTNLRVLLAERMVMPEETVTMYNENDELIRDTIQEGDGAILYKNLRELLIILTQLDVDDMEDILLEKIAKQVDGSEFSSNNCRSICWAIGAIAGAMNQEIETHLVFNVLKDLLALFQAKKGTRRSVVVATCILYIVGQYPRFLNAHTEFLQNVVLKCLEFMRSADSSVRDLACDTFLKISRNCHTACTSSLPVVKQPIILQILYTQFEINFEKMSTSQTELVYEALGRLIIARQNHIELQKDLERLMTGPNSTWDTLMTQARRAENLFQTNEVITAIARCFRLNAAVCRVFGNAFLLQVGRIYLDMLGLYKSASEAMKATARQGPEPTEERMRRMLRLRGVKVEILKLIEVMFIECDDVASLNTIFLPPLLNTLSLDYAGSTPSFREANVLRALGAVSARLKEALSSHVPEIFMSFIVPTVNMICENTSSYPEHRIWLYDILRVINLFCNKSLVHLAQDQFRLLMRTISWGMKTPMREVTEHSFNLALELLDHISSQSREFIAKFWEMYFDIYISDTLSVLCDEDFSSTFTLQISLLARSFQAVNALPGRLFPGTSRQKETTTNVEYLQRYSVAMIMSVMPFMQRTRVERLLQDLQAHRNDPKQFEATFREFLVDSHEITLVAAPTATDDSASIAKTGHHGEKPVQSES